MTVEQSDELLPNKWRRFLFTCGCDQCSMVITAPRTCSLLIFILVDDDRSDDITNGLIIVIILFGRLISTTFYGNKSRKESSLDFNFMFLVTHLFLLSSLFFFVLTIEFSIRSLTWRACFRTKKKATYRERNWQKRNIVKFFLFLFILTFDSSLFDYFIGINKKK